MPNQYDIGDVVTIYGSFVDTDNIPTDPSNIRCFIKNPSGTVTTYTYPTDVDLVKDSTGNYHLNISANLIGTWEYKWECWGVISATEEGFFFIKESLVAPQLDATKEQDLDYLIPYLRLKLGDINSASYRYTDGWLKIALVASLKELGKWWRNKYLINSNNIVSRNSDVTFELDCPPIIQTSDEAPIIIMAAIIIQEGSLENNSWNTVSWKDDEISYSNLESGRIKDNNIKRLFDELNSMLTPPTKKLARPTRGSLPGFINSYERNTDY